MSKELTPIEKALSELLDDNKDFDFLSPFDFSDEKYAPEKDTDSIHEYLLERFNEQAIIYYTNAIKYLADNDPSLCESISLANEYGFELIGIDSEKLATLLYQEKLRNQAYKLAEKIAGIYEQFPDEE